MTEWTLCMIQSCRIITQNCLKCISKTNW